MDFLLHPQICLLSRAFHILVSPVQMLIGALNGNPDLQNYEVLYVCGNTSRVLSGLDRRFTTLQVRRAFTAFQLMTVLEESSHSLLVIEHDPLLYEDAQDMVEYASQAMRQAAKKSSVLLYSPATDPFLEMMMNYADRAFYFSVCKVAPAWRPSKNHGKAQAGGVAQTTLEAF